MTTASNLIGREWVAIPGDALVSRSPAEPGRVVYSCAPKVEHVGQAVEAARRALPAWSALPREKRFAVLRRFALISKANAPAMGSLIADEVGKVLWESTGEAQLLAGKVDITLDPAREGGLHRVEDLELALSPTRTGACHFKPHGVMAVLGPFNFPAHLPNGHIVPALAMGNTVVFKPSDKAPAVGELLVRWFDRAIREELAGVPGNFDGVINLVQGKADVASALVAHDGIDAIAFTGSWPVARQIIRANLDRPGRLLALELGGSNAAVVMPDADMKLAAIEVVRSAFATTGQRCTCTRRLIVHEEIAGRLIALVAKIASNLIMGHPRATHPVFAGPMINEAARERIFAFQHAAGGARAEIVVPSVPIEQPGGGWYLCPGVMRVDRFCTLAIDEGAPGGGAFDAGGDIEIFGPLLRVATVRSLDEAIEQTNATRYGLAGAIFTRDQASATRFVRQARAGCINVNNGTAGASSKLPFGGLGLSGNHRPAGSFALDYCAYPVASMVEAGTSAMPSEGMLWDDRWQMG